MVQKDYVLTLVVLTYLKVIVADADTSAYPDERLKSNVELILIYFFEINELDGFTYDMEDREGNVLGRKTGVIALMYKKYYLKQFLKMKMDTQVLLMVTW